MSFIIDQLISSPKDTLNSIQQLPIHSPFLFLQAQKESFLKLLGKNIIFLHQITENDSATLHLFLNQVFRHLSAILKIHLNTQGEALFSLQLLTPEGQPLKMIGRERRLLFCRVSANRSIVFALKELKITVGMQSGSVKVQSNIYRLGSTPSATFQRLLAHLFSIFSKNLIILYQPINFMNESYHQSSKYIEQQQSTREGDIRINKLYYYSQFIHVFINFHIDSSTAEEQSSVERQKKQIDAIAQFKHCFMPIQANNGLDLFTTFQYERIKTQVTNFELSMKERSQIQQKTMPPPIPRVNQFDVSYIFNHIRITKTMQNTQLRRINMGGFSTIYLSQQIEYKYVGSYGMPGAPSDVMKGIPPQKRCIVVKREILEQGKKSRIEHQKQILQHLKNGITLFLPKYYFVNDPESPLYNDLLMDYIPFPTLFDYTNRTKQSMSLQAKLHLAMRIAQGLRYLQEYQIAHLDLKPANIMLSRGMMIKLIDYGQAYHPELKDQHRPGFTMPYSAPENYNFPSAYSHKNDVFSLGVILHQLLFGRSPFYLHDLQLRDLTYRSGSINNYWFCCPQGDIGYGEDIVMPILQLIIGKCLSANPKQRPELDWIILLLRFSSEILW